MKTDLKLALTRIEKGELLALREAQGKGIAVFSGDTWITQDSDRTDHVLGAGESFAFEGRGLTIVQAFSPAQVLVFDLQTRNDLTHSGTSATAALASGDAQADFAARPAADRERLDAPDSIDWHLEMRRQRSLAIGDAIARGSAALLRHLERLGALVGSAVLATLERWRSRGTARYELAQLDDHLLADIGVTRQQVERERNKFYWQE